jgi:hypothetical protein
VVRGGGSGGGLRLNIEDALSVICLCFVRGYYWSTPYLHYCLFAGLSPSFLKKATQLPNFL